MLQQFRIAFEYRLFTGTHVMTHIPPFTTSNSNKKRNSREMQQEESSRKQKRQRINPLPSSILMNRNGHRRVGEEGSNLPSLTFFEQFAFPQRDESDAENTEPHDIPNNIGRNKRISAKPKSKNKSNLPLFSSTPCSRFSFSNVRFVQQ